jgi:predicted Zn-dependent protease
VLALAALREKQTDLARYELQQLVAEFPGNPLFARELQKLNHQTLSAESH